MTNDEARSIDERQWRWLLNDLLCNCAAATRGDSAELLSEAYALLSIAPRSVGLLVGELPGGQHYEALLALEAFESAAILLLGDRVGYMLSSGPNGASLASIILPDMHDDVCAEGVTAGLALLTAFAAALLQGEAKANSPAQVSEGAGVRLN